MAVRHRLLKANPSDVRTALADGSKYLRWDGRPSAVEPLYGQRPCPGPELRHQVRLGPLRLPHETVVRRCEEGAILELSPHRSREKIRAAPRKR
ncbi:hypothetical protein [Streptomyces iranensis]|uniref:Uncharacterized protein n=1 Tax=Streptomyces iranensis TaxID=576784 RepID=A0A061A4B3_9ACTN|nr:hypothetical protein [Streptomyces iranensis]MBP2063736.1 hypothetical protein [Streptomyces iranensis]CDR17663.1 predicted protein [Streptomyces iranensis]